jgi:hypothetical protein
VAQTAKGILPTGPANAVTLFDPCALVPLHEIVDSSGHSASRWTICWPRGKTAVDSSRTRSIVGGQPITTPTAGSVVVGKCLSLDPCSFSLDVLSWGLGSVCDGGIYAMRDSGVVVVWQGRGTASAQRPTRQRPRGPWKSRGASPRRLMTEQRVARQGTGAISPVGSCLAHSPGTAKSSLTPRAH